MTEERRWVSALEFAQYLGVSRDHVYRLMRSDPAVKRVTRRLGGRVMVCLYAWQRGEEARMAGSAP